MNQIRKKGISLRTIHLFLIIGAVIISGLMLFSTYHLSKSFRHLTETSELQIELRKAARELMDASDYLTEKVQRFTIRGDRRYMEEYFKEAFESKHREEAIRRMSVETGSAQALDRLQKAMDGSLKLMGREYYAMRLVVDAMGYKDYPTQLREVALSAADRALSAEDKMRRATEMVLDDQYYRQKDTIRENMRASLDELEKMAYDTDSSALVTLGEELTFVRAVIILQAVGICFMVWLTARLGIHPVLNAVNRIKENSPIPEAGANEFRYLARAYNKMYQMYKSSLERLNFKASHDQLTGAYNRAGYDLLLSGIDLNSTYMMLVDVDDFKSINDNYGHEVGDRVLKKLVRVLKEHFRTDDYVCRLGGDEFVVFMVHIDQAQKKLVAQKIEAINERMGEAEEDLPSVSVSVGVVHGSEAASPAEMYEKSDAAMYRAKKGGKRACAFYGE